MANTQSNLGLFTHIKIKNMYIKIDNINFFYKDEENVLYIGVNKHIVTIELDPKKDNIKAIMNQLDNLFNYKEIK